MRYPGSLTTRRSFLGLGACGLLSLPHFQPALAAGKKARAKSVLVIFEQGGVSHMDTFDFKPELFKADGKKTGVGGGLSNKHVALLKPGWEFKPGGKSGMLVSDLFPHLRECA